MGLSGAITVLQCAHARLENGAFREGVNPSSDSFTVRKLKPSRSATIRSTWEF